jgi:hypothetical protein
MADDRRGGGEGRRIRAGERTLFYRKKATLAASATLFLGTLDEAHGVVDEAEEDVVGGAASVFGEDEHGLAFFLFFSFFVFDFHLGSGVVGAGEETDHGFLPDGESGVRRVKTKRRYFTRRRFG